MENDVQKTLTNLAKQARDKPREAIDWFKNKVNDLIQGSNESVPRAQRQFPKQLNRSFQTQKMHPRSVGRMFMFAYDPKTKDKLPYYDIFPLVILVSYEKDGFFGLNLHYVPPLLRTKIINFLLGNLNTDTVARDILSRKEQSKIQMSYEMLKSTSKMKVLQPCFKRYLFSHVRSNFLYVDPSEWEKSALLPTERFKKASKQKVFSDSMQKIGSTGLLENNKPSDSKPDKPDKTTDFFGR